MRIVLLLLALLSLAADYAGTYQAGGGFRGKVTCKLTRQGPGKWLAQFTDLTNGRRHVVRLTGEPPRLANKRAVLSGEEYDFQAAIALDGTFTASWRGGKYPGSLKMKEKE